MRAAARRRAPRHIPGLECVVCRGPARRNFEREAFDEVYVFCGAACAVLFDEAPDEYAFPTQPADED